MVKAFLQRSCFKKQVTDMKQVENKFDARFRNRQDISVSQRLTSLALGGFLRACWPTVKKLYI